VLSINDVSVVVSATVLWFLLHINITLTYILLSLFYKLASMVGIKAATFRIINVYVNKIDNFKVFVFDASKLSEF
jgi:hypothetical protein